MSYQCIDCGNASSRKFTGGKCPACGSYNVKSDFEKISYAPEKRRKTLLEMLIMLLLWGALLFGVWDRYLQPRLMPQSVPDTVKQQVSETAVKSSDDEWSANDAESGASKTLSDMEQQAEQ